MPENDETAKAQEGDGSASDTSTPESTVEGAKPSAEAEKSEASQGADASPEVTEHKALSDEEKEKRALELEAKLRAEEHAALSAAGWSDEEINSGRQPLRGVDESSLEEGAAELEARIAELADEVEEAKANEHAPVVAKAYAGTQIGPDGRRYPMGEVPRS